MTDFRFHNDRLYAFHVETVRAGQPRPYADSVYEFIVTDKSESPIRDDQGNSESWNGLSIEIIKRFCVGVLHFAKPSDDPSLKTDWFASRYTLEKIGDRKYRYIVIQPFCD